MISKVKSLILFSCKKEKLALLEKIPRDAYKLPELYIDIYIY